MNLPQFHHFTATYGLIAFPSLLAAVVLATEMYLRRRVSVMNLSFLLMLSGVGSVCLHLFVMRIEGSRSNSTFLSISFLILLLAMPMMAFAIIGRSRRTLIVPLWRQFWHTPIPPQVTGNAVGDSIRAQLGAWE